MAADVGRGHSHGFGIQLGGCDDTVRGWFAARDIAIKQAQPDLIGPGPVSDPFC